MCKALKHESSKRAAGKEVCRSGGSGVFRRRFTQGVHVVLQGGHTLLW